MAPPNPAALEADAGHRRAVAQELERAARDLPNGLRYVAGAYHSRRVWTGPAAQRWMHDCQFRVDALGSIAGRLLDVASELRASAGVLDRRAEMAGRAEREREP